MLTSEEGFSVVAVVPNGVAALETCALHRPSLVLTDVRMPKMDGFEFLKNARSVYPSTRILLLAGMPLIEEAARAREMGAGGYLPKSIDQDVLTREIRKIVEDPTYFACEEIQPVGAELLTSRELVVLKGVAQGKQREEIGRELGIGLESIKTHMRNILNKLGATNATAAVARAYELGILRV